MGSTAPRLGLGIKFTAAGLGYAIAVFNDEQMIRCDQCGKRVKLGASTCHHCGYARRDPQDQRPDGAEA